MDAREPPWRRWLSSPWVKLLLSLLLLGVLLARTDLSELAGAMGETDPRWLVLAFVVYLASMVVSAVRWMMLARPLGFDQPFRQFFASYFTGMFMNLFAPSTVAGDIGRALFLGRGRKRKALAFTTVLADRGLGFVVLAWVGAIAIALQPQYRLPRVLYTAAWVIPPATLVAWLYLPQLAVRVLSRGNRWRILVEQDLAPYWRDSALLLRTSAVAFLFHILQILSQVCVAWSLGLRVPAAYFFIFVPVINILGMIPVSFSGIGIREAGYVFFLARQGVSRHSAMAVGLLGSGIVLLCGLTGGLVLLAWRRHARAVPHGASAAAAPEES